MKKFLFLMILTMSFSSCAVYPRVTPKQKGVDKTFEPYIKEYRYLIGQDSYSDRFKKLHMNFTDLEPGILGRCWWLLNGELEIEMDKEWWYSYASFYDRQFVAYHELEHCIRKRMHTNRKEEIENIVDFWEEILYMVGIIPKPGSLPDGCPASIMHSHSLELHCQVKHYNYYIKEIQELDSK